MLKRLRLLPGWVEKRNKVLQSISRFKPQSNVISKHLILIIMTSAQSFEPFTFAGQEDVKTFSSLPSASSPLLYDPRMAGNRHCKSPWRPLVGLLARASSRGLFRDTAVHLLSRDCQSGLRMITVELPMPSGSLPMKRLDDHPSGQCWRRM